MDVVLKNRTLCGWSFSGVLLAVLETLEIIAPIYDSEGKTSTNAGTVSAGYQNFLVRNSSLICLILSVLIINIIFSPSGVHWNGFRCRGLALRFPRDGLRPKLRHRFTRSHSHYAKYLEQFEGILWLIGERETNVIDYGLSLGNCQSQGHNDRRFP